MTCQATFIASKSNAYYLRVYRLMKGDFKDKKDSKVKKAPNIFTNHSDSRSQSSQSG